MTLLEMHPEWLFFLHTIIRTVVVIFFAHDRSYGGAYLSTTNRFVSVNTD